LCCPSRAIIQRGQYAHNTGIFGNDASLGGGYEIFDQLDREKVPRRRWIACKTGCSGCVVAGPTVAGRQRTGVDERGVYARVMP
jgi:hypothetical protein